MTAHLPHFSQRLIPWQMFIDMGKTTAFVPTRCEWTKKSPKVNKWNDHFNILIAAVFLLVYVLCDLCMVSECVRAFNEIATRNDNNNSKQKCNQNKNINNNNTESNNHSSGLLQVTTRNFIAIAIHILISRIRILCVAMAWVWANSIRWPICLTNNNNVVTKTTK